MDNDVKLTATSVLQTAIDTGGFFNGVHCDSTGFHCLVLFGAPEAHENNLERALTFAGRLPFPARIAISSGTVYAGFLGFKQMGTYTVLGNQVNLAARIMRFESKAGVYVTESVASELPESNKAVSVSVRGISDKIKIYKLDGGVAEPDHPYEGRLLGREKEIASIIELASSGSSGKVLFVSASAGTGKSHLLWEAGSLLENTGYNRIHLRCDDIIRRSFGPFVTFLRDYFKQKKELSKPENRSSFDKLFKNMCLKLKDYPRVVRELKRTESFIAVLVGLDNPGSLCDILGPDGRQENTISALREFFLGLARLQPLFLVIDDIQWLDDSSESLVESLTRNLKGIPVIMALAARTLDDGSRMDVPASCVIDLKPLSEESLVDMVKYVLGGVPAESLKVFLAEHSGMNPFYLRQYAVFLFESGYLLNDGGEVSLAASPEKIPRGIENLLMARIDRLSGDMKQATKTASVLGFEFNTMVLAAMLIGSKTAALLVNGAREKLWSSISEIVYIFQHSLLRETAYSMQLESELVKLHNIAACAIEDIYPGDEAFFPDLAYHWEKAKDYESACFYLEKVLQDATNNGDVKLSYKYAVKLRGLLEDLPDKKEQLITVLLKEIQILGVFARLHEAVELAARTEELALAAGNRKRYAEAMGMRAWLTSRLGDQKNALLINEKALEIHNELGYMRGLYESTGYLAAIKFMTGHVADARKLFEKQLHIFEELKEDNESNAKVYNNMACTAVDLSEKQQILEKAIELSIKHKNKRLHSVSLGNLAEVFHKRYQFERAEEIYTEALEIAREIGDRYYISYHSCGLAILKTDNGDYTRAVEMLQEYYNTSRETGIRYGEAEALGYMGIALLRNGELEKALHCFDQSIVILHELNYAHYISIFQSDRARTLFLLGRLEEAEIAINESNSISTERASASGESENLEALPENYSLLQRIYFRKANTKEESLDCIRKVQKLVADQTNPVSAAVPASDLWQLLHEFGDNLPEDLSLPVQYNILKPLLDKAAREKPTHDIISIRDEITNI